ncbi:MAG: hypothetical protein GEU88_11495 [Solirubrobacterales bacterium]|nr:hypothetical protein [Solirubrobacterales bacterium]
MRRVILTIAIALLAVLAARGILAGSPHAPAAAAGAAVATGPSAGLATVAAPAARAGHRARPRPAHGGDRKPAKVPSPDAMDHAREFARGRAGVVSLAVVDSEGKLRGMNENRRYAAASVVKAMLLAAEVRRLKHAGEGIDSTTDSLLTAMITRSDNGAADAIYARVGDAGLFRVAKRAGMTRFTVAGHWGNAQITAADMARLFGNLDHALVREHREYAKGLLGSVIESQSWGIPEAAGRRWAVRFKGGWLPSHALVHQAAELRERNGDRELSIVVLTDDGPSFEYGVETVRGVAARLLRTSRAGA